MLSGQSANLVELIKSISSFYEDLNINKDTFKLSKEAFDCLMISLLREALVKMAQKTPEAFETCLDALPNIPQFWKDDILDNYRHLYQAVRVLSANKIQQAWRQQKAHLQITKGV